MNKSLLAVSLVAVNVLGFAGPVGATSGPDNSFQPGDSSARICTEDPEDYVRLRYGGEQNVNNLTLTSVTGSPQAFSFTLSLGDQQPLGLDNASRRYLEYWAIFLNFPCSEQFTFDGLEDDGYPFTQPEINEECLEITMTEDDLDAELDVVLNSDNKIYKYLFMTIDFVENPRPIGPGSIQISIDSTGCRGGGSEPEFGSGLFSDFRLPEVAEELPDTGPSNVAPLVAFATLMIFAGAGMITRSRRIARN